MPYNNQIFQDTLTRDQFKTILEENPGWVVMKFGAEWCGPCKTIEKDVDRHFKRMNRKVACFVIDIDESFDLFAYLKKYKMVGGIPAILAYKAGNVTVAPDYSMVGSDFAKLEDFFNRIFEESGGHI